MEKETSKIPSVEEIVEQIREKDPKKIRKDAHGNPIPWSQEHDYFMGFDPENPDIPTD